MEIAKQRFYHLDVPSKNRVKKQDTIKPVQSVLRVNDKMDQRSQ